MIQERVDEAAELDLSPLDEILTRHTGEPGALIPILQQVQDVYGYLPADALREVSRRTGASPSQIYGVATFYSQFYLTRRGRHVIRVCDGTACHVRGAAKIVDALGQKLHILPGQTTEDYRVTYEVVYCLGSCGLAPVAVVDDHVEGRLTPQALLDTVTGLK
jgi:NADH-quinone oxidoreductase subunit E